MLTRAPSFVDRQATAADEDKTVSIGELLSMLRRQWRVIAVCGAAGALLAIAYLLTATPLYTATSSILLDTRMNQYLQKQNISADSLVDTGFIDSQVEVLTSEGVAGKVVQKLGLNSDPEFIGRPPGVIGRSIGAVAGAFQKLRSLFGASPPLKPGEDDDRTAIEAFMRKLFVKRVSLTYVLDISFTSEDAAKSATIANEVAETYISGELNAQFEATKRATTWLSDRLIELKRQSSEADEAVQRFKNANDIVDTSRGQLNQQALSELSSQLSIARAATAESKARLDRLTPALVGGTVDATVTEALNNPIITRLRAQYLDKSSQEASLTSRFGPSHLAAVKLRNEMADIERAIKSEIGRIADAYRSDFEIAKSREESLGDTIAKMSGQAGVSNLAQVTLRQLESTSDSYKNLYDSFLQKFQEASQLETSPVTDTRVITTATTPLRKSAPKSPLALAGGVILGLLFGASYGLVRALTADTFETANEVQFTTGLPCFGIMPDLSSGADSKTLVGLVRNVLRRRSRGNALPGLWHEVVVDMPFSRFAEALRNAKVAFDGVRGAKKSVVVGVTSAIPREGKTTVTANIAGLVALTGRKVLLIDGDFHQRSLTLSLAPTAKAGLIEALVDPSRLGALVQTRPRTKLDVLPCALDRRVTNAADLLGSAQMGSLLAYARDHYDYIFIEFAPLIPVVDAKAAAPFVDAFVLVVEWGATKRTLVNDALAGAPGVAERATGIILNKADPLALKRQDNAQGKRFGEYYEA